MWKKHQNLLSNNNDAPSITKYGSLVRPNAQIVALSAHCAKCTAKKHNNSDGFFIEMQVRVFWGNDATIPLCTLAGSIRHPIATLLMGWQSPQSNLIDCQPKELGQYICKFIHSTLLTPQKRWLPKHNIMLHRRGYIEVYTPHPFGVPQEVAA